MSHAGIYHTRSMSISRVIIPYWNKTSFSNEAISYFVAENVVQDITSLQI